MDFEKIYRTLEECRQASNMGRLSPLPREYYAEAAGYVRQLDEAEKTEPNQRERDMLADEAKNVKVMIEDIMCQRMKLIIRWAAVDASRQTARDTTTMNQWEQALYTEVLIAVDSYQTETCRKIQDGIVPLIDAVDQELSERDPSYKKYRI
jgi:DNA replication initiation complex subunit (GINS family)